MWFELDGSALLVAELDECQSYLLDAVPLTVCDAPLPGHPFAALTLRQCASDRLAQRLAEAEQGCAARLEIASPPEVGADTIVLTGETGTTLALPGYALATISPDWSAAEVLVVDHETLAAQALVAGTVLSLVAERGYFAVHSSMAQREGVGVMFLGERSRGKTSSCLALGKAGWTVLADDRCYVHGSEAAPLVWGPGGSMRLRPDASELWTDLAGPMSQGRRWGLKAVVEAADLSVPSAAASATPKALFFPQVRGAGAHEVRPVGRAEALSEMLCSTGLVMLPGHAARQFQALAGLVQSAKCYRLTLGQDMATLPEAILEALA
jgi:hypothetical protein